MIQTLRCFVLRPDHQRIRGVSSARRAQHPGCRATQGGQACGVDQAILYVAKCPLAGMSAVTHLLSPSQLPANASHWMVMVHEPDRRKCTVLDFLPQEPLELRTALQLISGRSVQGDPSRTELRLSLPHMHKPAQSSLKCTRWCCTRCREHKKS